MPRNERLPAYRVISHLVVMIVVAGVLGLVVAGLAIPFAGVAGVGAKNLAETMDNLPEELETEELAQKTKILDSKGNLLAQVYEQDRITIPLRQISRPMVKSMIAIEDYRFYEHGAIDLKGTLRALITNSANKGVVQGGSSITQQLVKLTLVAQATTPRQIKQATDDTYARKIRELRYAIAMEEQHSKDWILERYLNAAYFGDGAYGVQAAARHYFDVNARELNVEQAALLAGVVKNPTDYDPTNNPERALERRNIVLDRMAELNVISREKAERIKAKELDLNVKDSDDGCVNTAAPFFCAYVIDYLVKDKSIPGKNAEERMHFLETAGLTIKTTINVGMQIAADQAVQRHVFQKDQAIGALALVEPGTGDVKALAQSRPMGSDKKAGETYLNYVVPEEYGDSKCCQAGSTFKVFTLAAAIEQGIPLNRAYDAPAVKTFEYEDYANCPGEPTFGYGSFQVPNSTSSGRMNLYSGTRLSVNTFYMRLEQDTGVCEPYELAKAMGIKLTNPVASKKGFAERIPFFTLGVASVSPLEMAEAYATFAARGLHCSSRPVTEILDSAGNVIREYDDNCDQVMEQSTADAVNDILRGVIETGFASGQRLAVPAAGKTGTTNEGRSVWFVGYTPTMAAAAMIGGANQLGTPVSLEGQTVGGLYRSSVSGSAFAAPIWGDAMKLIDDDLPYEAFVYPSSVPGAGVTSVPTPKPPKGNGGPGGGNGGGNGNGNGGNGNGNGNGGR